MQAMMLEVCFRENVEPDYPMGEAIEFENIQDFINFNCEQCDQIKDILPYAEDIKQKLQNREFDIRVWKDEDTDDVLYISIKDIQFHKGE